MKIETADTATALAAQIRSAEEITAQLTAMLKSGSPLVSAAFRTADGQTYAANMVATVEETQAVAGGMLQLAQGRLDALNAQLAAL